MSQIPQQFHKLYSSTQINQAVSKIGAEISLWANQIWQSSHTDIVAIPILRGGLFFFADLVRAINTSVEVCPVRTWGYKIGINNELESKMKIEFHGAPIVGRCVLLVDDICDSGRTLNELTTTLKNDGAHEVRSAALVRRKLPTSTFTPNWVGFEYEGNEWFVGYGMEDCERWRNLPDIYLIRK